MATRNYYGFVASLPALNQGEASPATFADFAAECAREMGAKDAGRLGYLHFAPLEPAKKPVSTGSAYIDEFLVRERELAQALACHRAKKLGRPVTGMEEQKKPGEDGRMMDEVAKAAVGMANPRQALRHIDTARWEACEEAVRTDDFFGIANVYAHAVKLRLLEKETQLDLKKGRRLYRECHEAILEEFDSRQSPQEICEEMTNE